jgi:hypothetical protein
MKKQIEVTEATLHKLFSGLWRAIHRDDIF